MQYKGEELVIREIIESDINRMPVRLDINGFVKKALRGKVKSA